MDASDHRRIDYIITYVLGAQSKKAWTDFTAPVALSGYRDHRPVRAMVPAVHANPTTTTMECRCSSGRTEGRTIRRSEMGRGSGTEEVPGRERREDH